MLRSFPFLLFSLLLFFAYFSLSLSHTTRSVDYIKVRKHFTYNGMVYRIVVHRKNGELLVFTEVFVLMCMPDSLRLLDMSIVKEMKLKRKETKKKRD